MNYKYLISGQHIYVSAIINGQIVVRPYTPVSDDDDAKGYFDLVIKIYFANEHPKFPEGGKMSQYLESLKLGDTIDVRGPSGQMTYKGNGEFQIANKKKSIPPVKLRVKKVGMIAGGTGITPMYQLMKHILRQSDDQTQLSLIFANQTEDDILIRAELEAMAKEHKGRVNIWYTLDRPSADWKYSAGFISADIISGHLPPPGADTLIVMCGPPPMINMACIPALDKLAYSNDLRFAY